MTFEDYNEMVREAKDRFKDCKRWEAELQELQLADMEYCCGPRLGFWRRLWKNIFGPRQTWQWPEK